MRRHGHAIIDPSAPEPTAYCDRCNFPWLHKDLQWQHEWEGPALVNLRLLVCPKCLDKPNESLRTIYIGQDPVPVQDPRPLPPYGNLSPGAPPPSVWDHEGDAWDEPDGEWLP